MKSYQMLRNSILTVCVLLVACGPKVPKADETHVDPKVIAHRGLISQDYPENTMPAIVSACKSSVFGIEYDVRLTKDNKLVVTHDEDISSTSNGKGKVFKLTLNELQKYNFGGKKSQQHVPIATFEEAFYACEASRKFQVIEIKDGAEYPKAKRLDEGKAVAQAIAEKVKTAGNEQRVVIGCFTTKILLHVQERYPNIGTHLFIGKRNVKEYISKKRVYAKPGSDAEKCLRGLKSVGVMSSALTREVVDDFHRMGKEVNAWGIENRTEYERMKSIGVDSVTLEDVGLLK